MDFKSCVHWEQNILDPWDLKKRAYYLLDFRGAAEANDFFEWTKTFLSLPFWLLILSFQVHLISWKPLMLIRLKVYAGVKHGVNIWNSNVMSSVIQKYWLSVHFLPGTVSNSKSTVRKKTTTLPSSRLPSSGLNVMHFTMNNYNE